MTDAICGSGEHRYRIDEGWGRLPDGWVLGDVAAVGVDGSGAWHAAVELEQVRNTVGSGDCFLAGMAVALARGEPLHEALRLAVACGAANAAGEETGYVEQRMVDALLGEVRLQRIDARP